MTQTLIFDAYTAYLSLVTGAAPAGFVVFDGPQVKFPTDQSFIVVGCDDVLSPSLVNAVSNGAQNWADLGASRREETFTIPAVLVVWSGDTDLAALRATAQTAIEAIGAALRPAPAGTGDAMLNNVLNEGGVGWCGLSVSRMQHIQDNGGAAAHVSFDLNCTAYL